MQEKLTINDIARLAGVSKATVSRVLNHNPSVDPALSERVLRIIEEHGFTPNITARGLAGGRTRLIGVLTPPLTWPAVPEIVRGVAEYIEDTSYEIVLYSISFERDHTDVLDRILAMRLVSGLLAILPGHLSRTLIDRSHHGLPLVMIDDQEEPSAIPWVGIDNLSSAYTATRHLLALGHRRIAHILGPTSYYCVMERYQGYRQALAEAGVAIDPALVFQGNFDIASGRQCAAQVFARDRSAWPSAIFASNDQMAYGILEIAKQEHIRVPEDIAVVGFDDNMLSAYVRPPLTTIHQPFTEMGRTAGQILLTMIEPNHPIAQAHAKRYGELGISPQGTDLETHQPIHIQLPTSIVIRASSGALQPMQASP
jgi:LacI family transcriptional regulator